MLVIRIVLGRMIVREEHVVSILHPQAFGVAVTVNGKVKRTSRLSEKGHDVVQKAVQCRTVIASEKPDVAAAQHPGIPEECPGCIIPRIEMINDDSAIGRGHEAACS
jgi:hypothetical protein